MKKGNPKDEEAGAKGQQLKTTQIRFRKMSVLLASNTTTKYPKQAIYKEKL